MTSRASWSWAYLPMKAPDKPTYVTIDFEKGIPVAVDGEKMNGVTIIQKLNKLGGENGIGIADMVENRLVGMKCRGVYETPGGTILYTAHEVLETICLDKETQHYKQQLAIKFAELVYNGQWFTPLREALSAFVDETQEHVTGTGKDSSSTRANRDPCRRHLPRDSVFRGAGYLQRERL